MIDISIGRTTSGREIVIHPNLRNEKDLFAYFEAFSNRDKLDVILAVQCLALREMRRHLEDGTWFRTLSFIEWTFAEELGDKAISAMKSDIGLHSAFAARDYGMSLLHPHFRW